MDALRQWKAEQLEQNAQELERCATTLLERSKHLRTHAEYLRCTAKLAAACK